MALGQFDPTGEISKALLSAQGTPFKEIDVGGPLTLDPAEHELPIVIHVSVVQSPEGEHEHEHDAAQFARGVVVIKDLVAGALPKRWDLKLTVPAEFKDGEARGIAVAVVPNKKLFAYETLTWCEHVTLNVHAPAAAAATESAANGEAGIGG
jgi:hypothetical protein